MRQSTRRRQLEQSPRGWAAPSHGPFGPVRIHALSAEQLAHADVSTIGAATVTYVPDVDNSGPTTARSMSMTPFFEYLHDHEATTDLAKALADVSMLRTSGARPVRVRSNHERIAS
jgi:hypothetical protein